MTRPGTAAPHDHAVMFYDRSPELVELVAEFVRQGLRRGDGVVLVATAAHLVAVEAALVGAGTDLAAARAAGTYVTAEASQALATFHTPSGPDRQRFASTVNALLDRAGDGRPVRVFGEMVAVLWDRGDVAGAIALEALWNALAHEREFDLLCAYPTSTLDGDLLPLQQVCELHSEVAPPGSYLAEEHLLARLPPVRPAEDERTMSFLPVPMALRAVRRFVRRSLTAWGLPSLIEDAELLVTELSANAVRHAVSPFRVSLSLSDGVIVLAVEDVDPARPELFAPSPDRLGGRGVALVDALSRRWGHTAVGSGKVVWAELAAS